METGEIQTSPTLSRLTELGRELLDAIQNESIPDGDKQEFLKAFDSIDAQWLIKLESTAHIISMLEYREGECTNEIGRVTQMRKTIRNQIAWLKENTVNNMIEHGEEKGIWFSSIGKVSVAKVPASVEITDIFQIPDDYIKPRKVTEADIMKSKIKEDWKETGTLPKGAIMITDKKRLNIPSRTSHENQLDNENEEGSNGEQKELS